MSTSYTSYDQVPQGIRDAYDSGAYNDVYMDPDLKAMLAAGSSARNTNAAVSSATASANSASPLANTLQSSTPYDTRNVANNDLGTYMANSLYGGSSQNIGQDSTQYTNMVKDRLGTDYAKADVYRQEAGQRIGAQNAKAGLSGVDTAGATEQVSRQASMGASAMNQDYQDKALALYGRNVSARQQGVSGLDMAGRGLTNAATPTPVPNYSSGISIICTELYNQGKISKSEWLRAGFYGYKLNRKTYFGYLTIAEPIVKLMKKSDKFSNLFVGWSKSIAKQRPNLFTRLMMPICFMVGYAREIKKEETFRVTEREKSRSSRA